MKRIYSLSSDGRIELRPHKGQYLVWTAKARFVLMLSGAQSGKTSFGPWWFAREINRTADPEGGDNDYLAVTTSFPLFNLKMLPAMQEVFCDLLRIGRYWPGARVIELKDPKGRFWARRATDRMWGRIILLSIGGTGGIQAATARAAWLDEVGDDEWDLNDWVDVQLRTALYQGRVLGTTTPDNTGWLKSEWYDRWLMGDPDYEVVQFPNILNPAFSQEEFERARRTLPDWLFKMRYLGEFTRPAGLIYNAFDPSKMIVDPFLIPTYWDRVCGIDFGGANTAQIWLALNPQDNRWYVYDEYLGGNVSTPEHVDRTKEHDADVLEDPEGSIEYVGGSPSEIQSRADWRAAGIYVDAPKIGGVEEGISRVIGLIKSDRFRVFRSCRGLLAELESYKRKIDKTGQPTNQIQDKRKFHRLDALRAAVTVISDAVQAQGVMLEEKARQDVWSREHSSWR